MNKSTMKRWKKNPWSVVLSLSRRGWLNCLSDKTYLSIMYRAKLGKKLDLTAPKTFNEKMQWMKLYDRNPIYSSMVDKYEVKQIVAAQIGHEHIVPVIGGPWQSVDEIDFDSLPSQFVLKTTHDCGGVRICKDKQSFDKQGAAAFLNRHMQRNYYLNCREWPYKNIVPRLFAEAYISDEANAVLPVYKIFCFDGKPKIIQAIQNDKQKDETIDYFDPQWNKLDLRQNFPNSLVPPKRPENLDTMLDIAQKLSQGHAFIRVDLYEANECVYFSEYTFYSDAGFAEFHPNEWDETLGAWIQLPDQK